MSPAHSTFYTVITADVIDSRRQAIKVEEKKSAIAAIAYPGLLTPFTISRGDEIQAVLEGVVLPLDLVRRLRYLCRPLALRIGIGIGRITSGLGSKTSWEMNGPAFFRSRRALEEVKKERRAFTSLQTGDPEFDRLAGALLLLIDTIISRWTGAQWEAVMIYEEKGVYQKAAEVLGIAYQNVEKRCRAARWWAVQKAESALAAAVRELPRHHLIMGDN
ncbi:MAG: hypothetical protein GX894_05935 [Clostridia bacterium]|nr:hypothetical protein [Clostridia bacterium]